MAAHPFSSQDQAALAIEPIEQAWTIPSRWSVDPEFAAFDDRAIFQNFWQYIGHRGQVAEPQTILPTGTPVEPMLLIHHNDGDLKVLSNVCRHRAGRVIRECTKAKRLTCSYHAWTYDLSGKLVATPQMQESDHFQKANYSLPKYRCDEEAGLVFVDPSGLGLQLSTWLGNIAERIAPIDLAKMHFADRVAYDIDCNWKVYVDNYMEGYHIRPVHPELASLLDCSHYTTEYNDWNVLQTGPIDPDKPSPYPEQGGAAYYYYIFPNLMLNILPGRCQVNIVWPLGPERCRVIFDYFYTESDADKRQKLYQEDHEFSDLVQRQDVQVCEEVQQGLAANSYTAGRYVPSQETGLYHFHRMLRQAYQVHLS